MSNNLAQYYTGDKISNLLVSRILIKKPERIVELGIGNGSLVKAAQRRWSSSKIIGGDIDKNNVENLRTEFPNLDIFLINGLSSKLNSDLKVKYGTIDVGICNPPYLTIKKNIDVRTIIEECKLGKIEDYKIVTSDLVFLAQYLRLLREGGELAIILPDGLITSHQFRHFRRELASNYLIKGVIELPEKVFKKTEAKTHILVIRKCRKLKYNVKLYKANREGEITDKIIVDKNDLEYRMDYTYHYWKKYNNIQGQSLTQLGTEIIRGSFSKKALDEKKSNFIHTSDLDRQFKRIKFKPNKVIARKYRCAIEGDIVIPRVGKRCLNRVLFVEKGAILLTDCLYILRAPKVFQKSIIDALNSPYGRDWVNAHSHGVCAKVISKKDLMNFIVPI